MGRQKEIYEERERADNFTCAAISRHTGLARAASMGNVPKYRPHPTSDGHPPLRQCISESMDVDCKSALSTRLEEESDTFKCQKTAVLQGTDVVGYTYATGDVELMSGTVSGLLAVEEL